MDYKKAIMVQKYLTFEFPTEPVEKLISLAKTYDTSIMEIYVDIVDGTCRDEDLMCWVQKCLMQEEEEEEMYSATCDCCGIQLSIDVPIMCYEGTKDNAYGYLCWDEKTLCNDCYWDEGYWNDDLNSDNEDEIDDFKKKNIYDTLCGDGHLGGAWGCDFCGEEGANNLKSYLEENDVNYYNAVYHYNSVWNSWNEKKKEERKKRKKRKMKRKRLVIIDAPNEAKKK